MDATDLAAVKPTLWAAADEMRANSSLTYADYRDPVLGLIFLAYVEHRLEAVREQVEAKATARSPAQPSEDKARSVLYVRDEARLSHLVELPEGEDLGAASSRWTSRPTRPAPPWRASTRTSSPCSTC